MICKTSLVGNTVYIHCLVENLLHKVCINFEFKYVYIFNNEVFCIFKLVCFSSKIFKQIEIG